ncbi:conserved exported hypothetical protein [Tenacibaculum litopenaei]|jgi:hypothetical protein|uniref:T9SS type A sorting domain-containing protein n=1 Tax=Tenacibaculum litopenaei TaxID=396016 RepID=UPI00389536D4
MKKLNFVQLGLALTFLFSAVSTATAQAPYRMVNENFENLYSGGSGFFTGLRLGPSWHAHKGKPRLSSNGGNNGYTCGPCGNGSRFLTLEASNSSGQAAGSSVFLYYPMKAGAQYSLEFDYRKRNTGTLYVIATNSATTNYNDNSPIMESIGTVNAAGVYSELPANDQQLVRKITTATQSVNWTGHGNHVPSPNFTFTPTKDYNQLVFLFVSSSSVYSQTVHLDGFEFSGPLNPTQGKVSMKVNGVDADAQTPITICSGEPVLLDGKGTTDPSFDHSGRVQFFTGVYRKDANGNFSAGKNAWNNGVPYGTMDLQKQFPLTSPQGVTTEYQVKLAISGKSNLWIEKTMVVRVVGKPGFYISGNFIAGPGQTLHLKVQGLPTGGNFSYKWFRVGTTNVLNTTRILPVTHGAVGNYEYRVEVTDNTTGCTTTRNIMTRYMSIITIDPLDIKKKKFPRMAETTALTVYPNPAQNEIVATAKEDISSVAVYSLQGAKLKEQQGAKVTIAALPKGVYILKAFKGKRLLNQAKFVKE